MKKSLKRNGVGSVIHFYLGRSGSGKSTKLKKEAIDQLNRFPIEGPEQLFLVPDQMSFQVEYELAKKVRRIF